MLAIALISGGLDSTLAAKVIQQQGIQVIPLHFKIPFCHRDKLKSSAVFSQFDLKIIEPGEDFLEVVKSPKHGFGSNMNPCIDCKIFMLRRAKVLMHESGAKFIITGEVLGQRPMSQHGKALKIIAEEAGLDGLVLRPLSAQLLDETIPEKEGWVDRNRLLKFNSRSRKPQLELAKVLGIEDYAQPAGGCLLTDPEFSKRLKDLMAHGELNMGNVELLKVGRHFRISPDTKLVVSRDELEGHELERLAVPGDYLFFPNADLAGPTSLARGALDDEGFKLCAGFTCYYCDLHNAPADDIVYKKYGDKEFKALHVAPAQQSEIARYRI